MRWFLNWNCTQLLKRNNATWNEVFAWKTHLHTHTHRFPTNIYCLPLWNEKWLFWRKVTFFIGMANYWKGTDFFSRNAALFEGKANNGRSLATGLIYNIYNDINDVLMIHWCINDVIINDACMHPSRQTDKQTYMVNVVKCVNVYNVASPLWLSWAPRTCVVQRPSAAKPPGGATWSAAAACDVCCCTWRRVGPESHGDRVLRSWVGLILGANILAGDVFPVFPFSWFEMI